jgi:hypothetical protein
MDKKIKKNSKLVTEGLRFIVEEFLEKSINEITAKIHGNWDAAKPMWEKLEGALFTDTFWMDDPDVEDRADIDYEKLLKKYHAILMPVWGQFKAHLFDYKYRIMPARTQLQEARETIDRNKAHPIFEYKELLKQQDSALDAEKFYDLTLKKSFQTGALKVSFDPGIVTFYRRNLTVINNLMDLLSGVDVDHFGRCEYCHRCIVLRRSDKRFCPGCAAKKYQKDRWAADPTGMREKEKLRYRERRKKPD